MSDVNADPQEGSDFNHIRESIKLKNTDDQLFWANLIEVFEGSKSDSGEWTLANLLLLLSFPPDMTWSAIGDEEKRNLLRYLACACILHLVSAAHPDVCLSSDLIRTQLSALLKMDECEFVTLLVKDIYSRKVGRLPSAPLKSRIQPLPVPAVFYRQKQELWHLAIQYLGLVFQIAFAPRLSPEEFVALMISSFWYLQYEQTEVVRYLVADEFRASVIEKAILSVHYVLVDNREPANSLTTCFTLTKKLEEHFDELRIFYEEYMDIIREIDGSNAIDPPNPQTLSLNPSFRTLFKGFEDMALDLIEKMLQYNLIVEMPSYTYDSEKKQLHWNFIRYGDGADWLKECLTKGIMPPVKEESTQICWPGDSNPNPNPEPQPISYDVFTELTTPNTFSNQPCSFLKIIGQDMLIGRNKPSIHHIISRDLLVQLSKIHNKKREEDEEFPQIARRFRNVIDYNLLKIGSIGSWVLFERLDRPLSDTRSSKQEAPVRFPRFDDRDNIIKLFGRWGMWQIGNLFVGPKSEDRGPFNPSKQKSETGFETNAEPILGPQRYKEFHELYIKIRNFLELDETRQTRDEVDAIMGECQILMDIKYSIIPFDESQWIKRSPTDNELRNLKRSFTKAKNKYGKGEKFWAIKSTSDSILRSVPDSPEPSSSEIHDISALIAACLCERRSHPIIVNRSRFFRRQQILLITILTFAAWIIVSLFLIA